ncbi:break repair meiotic recombinase recruitment factor 1 isoform X1 [Hyla sarda]|uniref:break repair meiotic recombinase recruitment factor 1 isoform X1 n=1 Tax=Hyla sarda TaxID=327740 RepID=UPI0024C24187|nr:break repair meiotic recombinase recruitment factor 1 isoform X1 [Hyla sarda]XP_056426238.1 break repair meiotic recombinase recruitment factor 1 isoform X1 [Hyla sarda]XP_056426239.1 break repair meiotic recombinase recruitment factor 1 isoform X1 [Hyla sarda]
MKRKRKATSTSSTSRKTSESSVKCPGPTSPEPNVKDEEPVKKNIVKEDESSVERNMEEKDENQTGPCQGLTDVQRNSTSLEVSSSLPLIEAVLPDGQQGHHHDVNAGDDRVLLVASTVDIADQVSDGILSNPSPMLTKRTSVTETTDISERCPHETVMSATSVTETTDISERCPHQTVMSATSVTETTDISERCPHETVMSATSVTETTDISERCPHETVMSATSVTETTDISERCPHQTVMSATSVTETTDISERCPHETVMSATSVTETTDISERCPHETVMSATSVTETTDISERCPHETVMSATSVTETTDISERCPHQTVMSATSVTETTDISERCPHETVISATSIKETTDVSKRCPYETVMSATSIKETTDIRERCPHETVMPSTSIMETTDVSEQVNEVHIMSGTLDFPLMVMEGIKDEINQTGCESGDASEMLISDPSIDRNVSVHPADPNSDLQASQKHQPQNPNLLNLPPEITEVKPENSDLQDSQKIKEASSLSDPGVQGRDGEHCQLLHSQPEEIWTPMTDQTLLCGMNIIQSQQTDALGEDPCKLTNGLDLPDSQLLGAWEDSFTTSTTMENHISDHLTPPWHRQEISAVITLSPSLPVITAPARDTGGPQQRRREDATSTVQGLIVELSNINRLIMGTYRELRQKRIRHTVGRGSGRRRRDM